MRQRLAIAVTALVVLALAAPVPAQKRGGVLKFAIPSVKPGLDPAHTTTGDGYMLTQAIFSNLTRVDENLEARPQLAQRWEASAGSTVWTFHLVRGAKFHNGREIGETCEVTFYGTSFIAGPTGEILADVAERAPGSRVAVAEGVETEQQANLLRLLNLSKPVQDMLTAGLIEMGHARALLPLSAGQQRELAHEIEEKGLSVREAERRVSKLKGGTASRPVKKAVSRDIRRLEEALSETLGMQATIHTGRQGGRLQLNFANIEQLQTLIDKLGLTL